MGGDCVQEEGEEGDYGQKDDDADDYESAEPRECGLLPGADILMPAIIVALGANCN